MKRIGLNIICNNDAATIGKMLESVRSITDLIIAVDMGSTDETIFIIKKFGFLSNTPTFVYKRPFDNFSNSRNYALDKLLEVVQDLSWPLQQTWGLAIDCDEIVQVGEQFGKDQLSKNLYLVSGNHANDYFRKPALFKLSHEFRWEHPVHETLTWSTDSMATTIVPGLNITRETQKTIPEKAWLNYAKLLTDYAETGHRDFQTIYHIGESYKAAGDSSKMQPNAKEYYLAAEKYYEIAAQSDTGSEKEKALAHYDRADSKLALNEAWENVQPLFLLAYDHDMQQAESVAAIIRHYMSTKQWPVAHLFSSFAYDTYHNKPPELAPTGGRMQKSLYQWELLFYQYICCYHTKRKQETKALRKMLKKHVFNHPSDLNLRQLIAVLCSPALFSSAKSKH